MTFRAGAVGTQFDGGQRSRGPLSLAGCYAPHHIGEDDPGVFDDVEETGVVEALRMTAEPVAASATTADMKLMKPFVDGRARRLHEPPPEGDGIGVRPEDTLR